MGKYEITLATFNSAANRYQDKYMDIDLYNESLDAFCVELGMRDARILELACGPGNITRYLMASRPDFTILATDLAPNMIKLARINCPGAAFRLLDCRALGTMEQQFDAIVCGFCLPYLDREDMTRLFFDASKVLAPGGVLYLSAMEGKDADSGFQTSSSGERVFIHYYQGDELIAGLEACGFEIVHFMRQHYPSAGDKQATDLILIARLKASEKIRVTETGDKVKT